MSPISHQGCLRLASREGLHLIFPDEMQALPRYLRRSLLAPFERDQSGLSCTWVLLRSYPRLSPKVLRPLDKPSHSPIYFAQRNITSDDTTSNGNLSSGESSYGYFQPGPIF